MNPRTNEPTDRRTDGWTRPLIELRGASRKQTKSLNSIFNSYGPIWAGIYSIKQVAIDFKGISIKERKSLMLFWWHTIGTQSQSSTKNVIHSGSPKSQESLQTRREIISSNCPIIAYMTYSHTHAHTYVQQGCSRGCCSNCHTSQYLGLECPAVAYA